MIKLLSLLLLASFSLVQCNDPEQENAVYCNEAESFTLKNMTGLDGCSWALVRGDRSYEPINLADFVMDPVEDQQLMLEIVERPDFASVCLVGEIVEIICSK